MPRKKRIEKHADCHPGREHYAHGLCAVCYFDQKRKDEVGATNALEVRMRNELVELHKATEHVVNLGRQAKAIVRENLPRYAELHLTAAEVAAANGDSRPAFEMLSGVNIPGEGFTVDPPKKDSGGGGGVQVFVGVNLGGVPSAAEVAETIDAEKS